MSLLCALVLSWVLVDVFGTQTIHIGLKGKQANLDRYESSCGLKDMKIIFNTESISFDQKVLYMNHSIYVKEDISGEELALFIKIVRCKSKENPDTCEDFYKQSIPKFCSFLTSSNHFWKPYYDAIEPKFMCPLKKGVYKGTNSAIQASTFLMRPSAGYFWKVNMQIFEGKEKKVISCAIAEAQVSVTNE